MTARSFSTIIPTYNRADLLRIALETVAALDVPDGWSGEAVVIDNASTDHTAAMVESLRRDFPLPLRRVLETRQGLNHARNRGMAEAGGEWLVYLDDDIRVAPGWLQGLAEADRLLGADAVTGPVLPWFEGEVPPWCTGRVLDSVISAYSRKGDQMLVLPSAHSHELPGCNFAVRRALAVELGGFHPALDRAGNGMLAGGDFEFAMRLADHGARSVYTPRCAVEHFVSSRKMSKAGLQQRWRGLGATAKAIRQIRQQEPQRLQQCRLFLRMHRFRWRAACLAVRSPDAAFRWKLEALRLHGLLFARFDGLTIA